MEDAKSETAPLFFERGEVKTIEDRDGVEYPEYEYRFSDKKISLVFKHQEQLFDPELVKGKTVIYCGDLPYAREASVAHDNWQQLKEQASDIIPYHRRGKFQKKYHGRVSQGWDEPFKDLRPVDAYTQIYREKPQTGLSINQPEKISQAAREGKVLLLVDGNDPESILDAAVLARTLLAPEAKGEKPEPLSPVEAYDLIIAASFNEKGLFDQANFSEGRRLLWESQLGSAAAYRELEAKKQDEQDNFPPSDLEEIISKKDQLIADLKTTHYAPSDQEALVKRVKQLETIQAKYETEGKLEIPESVIAELDKHVGIHMTKYYPVYNEADQHWYIPTHAQATGGRVGRNTVHFALDGVATIAGMMQVDTWQGSPYAIVAPLGQLVKANGLMRAMQPADTFWLVDPTQPGVRLPENATIISLSGGNAALPPAELSRQYEQDIQNDSLTALNHRGPKSGISKITSTCGSEYTLQRVLADSYQVEKKNIGFDEWASGQRALTEETELKELVSREFPFMPAFYRGARHESDISQAFEDAVESFHDIALLANRTEELKKYIDVNQYRIPTHWTALSPAQLIEQARQRVVGVINNYSLNWLSGERRIPLPRELARQMVRSGLI